MGFGIKKSWCSDLHIVIEDHMVVKLQGRSLCSVVDSLMIWKEKKKQSHTLKRGQFSADCLLNKASGVLNSAEGSNIAPQRDSAQCADCTSPSLVSTVRTRILLFTWASGVLVSKLVSER